MLTAKEARDAADKTHKDWEDSSWAHLQDEINDRVKNGHYSLQAILVDRERHNLIQLGYIVEKVGSINSSTYTITWKHINEEIK
jgi:hypothetical protein